MNAYKLVIIGGGAAAFAAAIAADKQKAKTALINAGLPLGGTCVNVGCVPSKKLLWAGEVLHLAKNHGVPGLDIEVKDVDWAKVVTDELNLVEKMREDKYESVLKDLEHITYIEGKARFISTHEVDVNGKTIMGDNFIIATGSTARVPKIEGLHKAGYITHIEALKLKSVPPSLAIIGGSVQALEFAQLFSRFGSNVIILYRGEHILKHGERQVVERLVDLLKKEGIQIITQAKVVKAEKRDGKKMLSYKIDYHDSEIAVDEILLAAGKIPNTDSLDLAKTDVRLDSSKAVVVNEYLQTSADHIYAAGDVIAAPRRLEMVAGKEGTLAAQNALGRNEKIMDYTAVPYTVFTDPQFASVGLTEEAQMKKYHACACRSVSFEHIPKAIIMGRTEGIIKMAIHPETKVIEGVHILAPHAGELIAEAMMLVKNKNTIDDVIDSLPMFPTLAESIKLAARSFYGDISKLSCCV